MIMDFSRKNRKVIFWGLIILVGVPFIFITTDYIPFADSLGMASPEDIVVAAVGDVPVTAEEYRQQLDNRALQMNPDARERDYKMLAATGDADTILNNLIDAKLMEREVQQVDLSFDKTYLDETLKKDPSFQNEQGEFNAELWNEWVRDNKQQNVQWDAIRDSVGEMVRQRVLLERVTASARVRESELRKEFEKRNTSVRVKYMPLQFKVEPTEEQIKAHYETNKVRYDLPAQRRVEFVAFSVEPPRPAILDELVQRARAGEDFEKLAQTTVENATLRVGQVSDWTALANVQAGQEALFSMTAGQVTDPVVTDNGYAIYKLVEERTTPDTNQKEVRFQALDVFPLLSPQERTAIQDRANAVAAQAKANGDLNAAAMQAGAFVQTAGPFSVESEEVAGLPKEDAMIFARMLAEVPQGQVSEVISGRKNLYVAKVTEVVPPVPQPLEAVRDKVLQNTVAELRQNPEYMQRVNQVALEIPQKAKTLEEIKALYPDVDAEIKETGPFTPATYDWSSGPLWNPEEIVAQLTEAGPGKVVGPIRDMMGGTYFAQLVESTPPDEKVWAEEYPKEKEQLRTRLQAQRQGQRMQDYLAYLKQNGEVPIRTNDEVIAGVLGLNEQAEATDGAKEGEAKEAAPAEAGTPAEPAVTAPLTPAVPNAPDPSSTVPDGSVPVPPAGEVSVEPAPAAAAEAPAPAAPETAPATPSDSAPAPATPQP